MTQFEIEKLTGTWVTFTMNTGNRGQRRCVCRASYGSTITSEEADRVKDILASMNTMLEQEYDKFIMGVKDISEYDIDN